MADKNTDEKDAQEDVDSIKPGDSEADVESKEMGIDHLTGLPSEVSGDAREAPEPT